MTVEAVHRASQVAGEEKSADVEVRSRSTSTDNRPEELMVCGPKVSHLEAVAPSLLLDF